VPPTTAALIRDQELGELVGHDDIDLSGIAAPQSVARQKVRAALTSRASTQQIEDAVLVADELVGNALRHGDGAVAMTLDIYEKGAAVGVLDRRNDTAAIPSASTVRLFGNSESVDLEAVPESGLGLFLVDQFATAWAVEAREGGKVVMAVFALIGGAL